MKLISQSQQMMTLSALLKLLAGKMADAVLEGRQGESLEGNAEAAGIILQSYLNHF